MRSVNPNAQKEVQAVLDYLESIRGKKVIAGQHTQTMEQKELKYIENVTGDLPALVGFELLGYSPNINYDNADEECLTEVEENKGTLEKAWEWAERKGLITFTWHWFSPIGGHDKSFYTRNTDFDASKAVIPGTEENKALIADLDYMADLFKPFCDKHIPILWRPIHENEGDWFWWGAYGRDTVRKLYRIIYERFTNVHHLDNLIWVFNSTQAECYPGDDIIDIISRDMYPPDHVHTSRIDEYNGMKNITSSDKMVAIAETGTLPDVQSIIDEGLDWLWFMTWSNDWGASEKHTSNDHLRKTYSYENTVKISNLPELY